MEKEKPTKLKIEEMRMFKVFFCVAAITVHDRVEQNKVDCVEIPLNLIGPDYQI